jgi:hypothetical protein
MRLHGLLQGQLFFNIYILMEITILVREIAATLFHNMVKYGNVGKYTSYLYANVALLRTSEILNPENSTC